MRSTSYTRVAAAVLGLALGAVPLVVAPALAKPSDAVRRRPFSLFALPTEFMQVNNIYCPVSNRGLVCVDPTFSPVLEGGFWPRGTPDSYIFNSGVQFGGVISNSPFAPAGFNGVADTVGVYFMDPRGRAESRSSSRATSTRSRRSRGISRPTSWASGAVLPPRRITLRPTPGLCACVRPI